MHRVAPRLLFAAALTVIGYLGLGLLLQVPALRAFPTTLHDSAPWLGVFVRALTPDAWASAAWDSPTGLALVFAFGAVSLALVGSWAAMLRWVRVPEGRVGLPFVLVLLVLAAGPLLGLGTLLSDDLYLYAFYGRIVGEHGGNPFLTPPSAFWTDPLLWRVPWPDATAAYGPAWVLLSTGFSALADGSPTATVLVYRLAGLALHVATTVLVFLAVRARRPADGTWAALFYGLNPLVLLESVGSAHSDVLLGLWLALALWSVTSRRPALAGMALGAALMTKAPVAVVLAPVLAALIVREPRLAGRLRVVAVAGLATAVTALALYAPLWAGPALLDNIRTNPASHEYLNSMWQLVLRGADMHPEERFVQTGERLGLTVMLVAAVAVATVAVWRGRSLAETVGWTWVAFCGLLSWVWPWYLVPLIAIAAIASTPRLAWAAGALSLGGVLFWMGWTGPPHPQAPWLFTHRALLFFGPALLLSVPLLLHVVSAAAARLMSTVPAVPSRLQSVSTVPRDLGSVDG